MRVMDGVIRSGAGPTVGRPMAAAVMAAPLPVAAPLRSSAPRMDGLIHQAMMAPLMAESATFVPLPEAQLSVRRWPRPAVAFSLLLPALAISAGAFAVTHTHAAAPADRTVSTSKAVTKVAAQAVPTTTPAPAPSTQPVVSATHASNFQSLVNSFVATGSGEQYGIVVKDLTTGSTSASGADTIMNSASLYKLFVAQRVLAGIDTGKYTLGQSAHDDYNHTVDQCLNLMITISDNNCGRALGSLIGWEKQNEDLATLGFTHTNLKTLQQTSASDVALYFERLYKGTLLSPSSTTYLMNLLKSQRVNNRLPQGLPAGTVFAHKTGDLWDVVHDAGIVYGPKGPYLVVVMSGKWKNVNNAPTRFADLSRQLYQLESQ